MNVWYDLYQAARRAILQPIFSLTGLTSLKYSLSAAEEEFTKKNHPNWPPLSVGDTDSTAIMVYGHMAGEGINYLCRLGMISRGIAEASQRDIFVVLPRCEYNSQRITKLFQSFGIQKFHYLSEMDWQLRARFLALVRTFGWFCSRPTVEDLLNLSYKEIAFGDVVYNDIIHDVPKCYTISKVKLTYFPFLFRFFLYTQVYDDLLERKPTAYLVTTHIQYSMFGILVRLALARGIPVIETTDLTTYLFTRKSTSKGADYFAYTEGKIREALSKNGASERFQAQARDELQARMKGTLDQMDVQLAYAGKTKVDEKALRSLLDEQDQRPIVSIFAHVFSDTPVSASRRGLYRDYYHWLTETLEVVSHFRDTRWVFKPHPAQARYGELEDLQKLFNEIVSARKHEGKPCTISWCPETLSTDSLIQSSKAIVTCQGTIALECSAFGVPAIVAGTPFYGGFGFTHEPSTREEYIELLESAHSLPTLTQQQQESARAVYGAHAALTTADENELLDAQLLDLIWGYHTTRDLDAAYRLFTERMENHSLREQKLFQRAQLIAEKERT